MLRGVKTITTRIQSFIIQKYEDELLCYFVKYMMIQHGGENEWFEVKAGLPKPEITKFHKMISAISNSGGGLIYYGWDENSNLLTTIDRDDIERKILPEIKKCDPEIPLTFYSINFNSIKGLFVGIPTSATPVRIRSSDDYYYRAGGHKIKLESKETLMSLNHFEHDQIGHLYNEKFEIVIKKIKPVYVSEKLLQYKQLLSSIKQQILDDIKSNWKIRFGPWLSDPPYSTPIRVFYDMWIPALENSDSLKLQSSIMKIISKILEYIEKAAEISNLKSQTINLKKYLRDESTNERDNPINHRRCLTTLMNRLNIWNFADARIFLERDEKGFYLYQDSAGRDYAKEFARIDRIDIEEIENLVNIQVKERYYRYLGLQIDDIVMLLNQVIIQLNPDND